MTRDPDAAPLQTGGPRTSASEAGADGPAAEAEATSAHNPDQPDPTQPYPTQPDPGRPAGRAVGWAAFALGLAGLALLAGPGAWMAAGEAQTLTLRRAEAALRQAQAETPGLTADQPPWAAVEADGLRLRLIGAFPSQDAHIRTVETLTAALPMAEVEDLTRPDPEVALDPGAPEALRLAAATQASAAGAGVGAGAEAAPPAPVDDPTAPLTLARDADGLTVAGAAHPDLVAALREALSALPDAPALHDAALPRRAPPSRTQVAVARAAALAIAALTEARAEIGPGVLSLDALAPTAEGAQALETRLRETTPPGTALLLDISTPPPAFRPFRFKLDLGPEGATLLACDMPSAEDRARALAAVAALSNPATTRQGPETPPPQTPPSADVAAPTRPQGEALCRIGAGAPSSRWADAAAAGTRALAALGEGRFEMTDSEARLIAGPDASAHRFAREARALAEALPTDFVLRLEPPTRPDPPGARDPSAPDAAPRWFVVSREPGHVRLAGAAPDAASRDAVAAMARARFGAGAVSEAMELTDAAPPPAWRRAALASLAAIAPLEEASLSFDGERIRLAGRTGRPASVREATRTLSRLSALGVSAETAVTIDLPALAEQLPLPPQACIARLAQEVEAEPIQFDPGAVAIAKDSGPVLDRLAAILKRCRGVVVEIGGHTDSQGRESTNLGLSRGRAEAVMQALFARGASYSMMISEGYGEGRPIADNRTEEGRARNRRIEFSAAPTVPPALEGEGDAP